MIAPLNNNDLDELQEIHQKYYKTEFSFADFLDKLNAITIRDDSDNSIILAGGIRPILEIVSITNKSKPVGIRAEALRSLLQIASYSGRNSGYHQLHLSVSDERWKKVLLKRGFRYTRGTMLITDI